MRITDVSAPWYESMMASCSRWTVNVPVYDGFQAA
jgi:hypothetical protein